MKNVFFIEIKDEMGDVLGYEFDKNSDWGIFAHIKGKYEGLDLNKPIYFKESRFEQSEFNVILSKVPESKGGGIPNIVFKNCDFNFQNSLTFSDVEIEFVECTLNSTGYKFKECINSKIFILNRRGSPSIKINNSKDLKLNLKSGNFSEVKISKVESLSINTDKIKINELKIDYCSFHEINLYSSNIGNITFGNSEGYSIVLSGVSGGDITLFDDHKIYGNQKENYIYENIDILNCKFSSLNFNCFDKLILFKRIEIKDTSNFNILSAVITSLTVIGTGLSNVLIFSCKINSLTFLYFKIKENFVFNLGTYGGGWLALDNALLKGVEVNPSFLHSFNNIEFKRSSIDGLIAHSYKPVSTEVIRSMKGELMDSVDFCRELNALMIAQNNKHYASVYRALELELRAKANDSSLSWFDKQVLNLNHWSNVHGTMPQKALFWIFVLMFIQFGVINLDLAIQSGIPYGLGFDFLKQNYSYFIKPFTFLTDVEGSYKPFGSDNMKITFSWWVKGFDFLYKIFYAYLLYQFIAAFRKFNK